MQRKTPPFRADHVGSLLRPRELKEARARYQNQETTATELASVEDRVIQSLIARQAESPRCGFASTEEGNLLTETEQWRKLSRIVEIASEVWG